VPPHGADGREGGQALAALVHLLLVVGLEVAVEAAAGHKSPDMTKMINTYFAFLKKADKTSLGVEFDP
jgi:hypothetical protein